MRTATHYLPRLAAGLIACCLLLAPTGASAQATADRRAEDQYILATEWFGRGMYELAIQEYEKYLQEYPRHDKTHQARLRIGEAHLRLDQYAESIAAYQRALEDDPETNFRAEALVGIGLGHFYLDKVEEAVPFLVEAGGLVKEDDEKLGPIAFNWLGECYFQLEEWDKAIIAYEKVGQWPRSEQAPQALYSIGFCYSKKGDHERAYSSWLEVGERYPEAEITPEALLRAGESLVRLEAFDRATETFQQVMEKSERPDHRAQAQLGLGWIAFHQEKFADARAAFQAVAENYPDSRFAAQVPLRVADCYYHEENYEAAAKGYEAGAQDEDPEVARESLYWLGMSRLQLEQPEPAAAAFRRLAGDRAAGNLALRARLRLGDLNLDAAQHADAAQLYRQVLEADASGEEGDALTEQALYGLGVALYRQREHDAAEEQFAALLRRSPRGELAAMAAIGIAQCRFEQEDPEGAARRMKELVGQDLSDEARSMALLLLGQAHYRLNQHNDAVDALRELLENHGRTSQAPTAAATLIAILREQQRMEEAQEVERALLERFGEHSAVADAFLTRADADRAAGDHQAAITVYKQVLERAEPESATMWSAHVGLALCYAAVENQDGLAEQLKALEKAPDDYLPHAHFLVGAFHERAERFPEALAAYRQALGAEPSGDLAPVVHFRLGSLLAAREQFAEAIEVLAALVERHPEAKLVPDALYEIAWAHIDANEEDEEKQAAGWAVFERLSREFPEHRLGVDATFRLAERHFAAEDYPRAAAGYQRVVASEQGAALADRAWYKLGWCMREQENWSGAAEAFLAVVNDHSRSDLAPESLLRAGEALAELGELAAAAEQLRGAAALRPRGEGDTQTLVITLHAKVALARVLVRQEKPQEALELLEPLVSTSYGQLGADAGVLHADILFEQEEYAKAFTAYVKVVALFGRFAETRAVAARAQFQAGECQYHLGERDKAAAEWRKCVSDFEDTEWAQRARQRLDGVGVGS